MERRNPLLHKRVCRIGVLPLALCIALLACTRALAVDVENPPMGVFSDEWYAIMLKGQKSGHMHSSMERRKSGEQAVIHTLTEMTMIAGRAGASITVTVIQETDETLAGKPLAFSNTMKLALFPKTIRGVFKDGQVEVTTTQLGQNSKATYKVPEDAMMNWAIYKEQLKRGLKPGTRYSLPLYDPSISPDKVTPAVMEIGNKEKVDLFGRTVEAIKSRQIITLQSLFGKTDVETVTWLDDAGDAVKLEMNLMDIPIELIACPKPVALAKDNPMDLMAETLIHVKEPVDAAARQITYRLKWASSPGNGATSRPAVPETDMQRVQSNGPAETLVTITRRSAQPAQSRPATMPAEQRERYLAAAPTVDYKDPTVKALAKRAAGDARDPYELADRLRRFVGDYVRTKNLSVGFGTASEVARSREGDCTEHAVLLAGLGRAVGIPTRLVFGIVYADDFAGGSNVFVGHMWTQFWIRGRWVDLDAALRQTDVDPTHIALGLSAADENGLADMVSSLWLTLGKMSVEVVKSE